ncbi:MAG: hypothetical protein QXT25_04065 [Candidatus Anstonellaceae archaeon]
MRPVQTIKKILCAIGIHQWGRATYWDNPSSNVKEFRQKCSACGKTKTWIERKSY